jgi:DTW domain-containing protein YfiP
MNDNAPARRLLCARCERPERACLCAWITPTPNDTSVLILQHPLEVRQAKGSARLLQLSLRHCQVRVGEAWDGQALRHMLDAPGPQGQPVRNVLLYPDTGPVATPAPVQDQLMPSALRLVVLDGTWRKSLKMLHLNPPLAALPRLALPAQGPSRYLIRKAHRPDQLSTLEAACLALARLEQQARRYEPLLTAFDAFVSAQGAFSTSFSA